MFILEPMDPFGAVVMGIDLSESRSGIEIEHLERALDDYSVLVFRNQNLSAEQHVSFCRRFGELDLPRRKADTLPGFPEIFVIGTRRNKAAVSFSPSGSSGRTEEDLTALEWHADHSQYSPPSRLSTLYGVEVPPSGGDTLFASTYDAYERLPAPLREQYEKVKLLHSIFGLNDYLRRQGREGVLDPDERAGQAAPAQAWPLVRKNPRNGRKALYFCSEVSVGAEGFTEQDGRDLIASLTVHTVVDGDVLRHKWRDGDFILWDNRSVIHAATPFDETEHVRILHRVTVTEDLMVPNGLTN